MLILFEAFAVGMEDLHKALEHNNNIASFSFAPLTAAQKTSFEPTAKPTH